jgi:lipid A disaccharide synthetase
VSLPNVLAGRFVVPKCLQEHATAASFAPAAQPRLELEVGRPRDDAQVA